MTIRQISEAAGCSMNTVRTVGKTIFPDVKAPGRGLAIDYDREQSIAIMDKLPKKNYVGDPTKIGIPTLTKTEGTIPQSSLTQKDLEMIGAIVANVMVNMEARVSTIEHRIEEKTSLLPPPAKDPRKELNQLVREYAQECLRNDYHKAWNNLYKDFYYRLDLNVKKEAEFCDIKPIEWLDQTDNLEMAISIVKELMKD